jgi:hypothetical protein
VTPEEFAQKARQKAREDRKQRLRDDRAIKRELDAEERAPLEAPDVATLRERLARPRTETAWRIERWQPAHSRIMLSAQFKAGKTTLVGNLIRSLTDGDPFLSRDVVTRVKGCVALLDFEMGQTQLDEWLRVQRIRADDRVLIIPLRGMASAFDITLPEVRSQWVARFRQAQVGYLAVDCLRPILDAIGLDEHHEAGRFLVHFDTLLREANIPDALSCSTWGIRMSARVVIHGCAIGRMSSGGWCVRMKTIRRVRATSRRMAVMSMSKSQNSNTTTPRAG